MSIENPTVPVSAANFLEFFGYGSGGLSSSGVSVTVESALGVPAVWAGVNFLSGSLASLSIGIYRKSSNDRSKVKSKLATILNEAPNDEMTSFQWRRMVFDAVFTGGRSFTFIERNAAGAVMNLWPLDPGTVKIERKEGRKTYSADGKKYSAAEIIDLAFMMKPDGVGHRGPVASNKDVIGMAIAATQYASKFFQNGGVPPFAVTGKFITPGAMQRAADDMSAAVRKTAREQRQALVLPDGLEIKPIGVDPEKSQLVESQKFLIEQIARIYSLPPTFLQDLSRATFTNSEQQDLHFVKHTLLRWVKMFEQELNLKLFGRNSSVQYVEMNVDTILRGDFKTRMDGYAQAIQNGVLMPNEARRMENRPDDGAGSQLFMQGAMLPIGDLAKAANGDTTNAA